MKYTATFSNGATRVRTTERTYSHAWLARYKNPKGDKPNRFWETYGFHGSEDAARKELRRYCAAHLVVHFAEVVPCKEVVAPRAGREKSGSGRLGEKPGEIEPV